MSRDSVVRQGEHSTYPVHECDASGCRELADYRLEAHWRSDETIPVYLCLVHMPWGIKELQAYRVEGEAPVQLVQSPLRGQDE